MSLKSKLADLEIKDQKLKSFLNDLIDTVSLVSDNVIISDREYKTMSLSRGDSNFCRIRPQRLIVDEIRFTDDLNNLTLRSSCTMWASANRTTTQPISSGAFTNIEFDNILQDTDSVWDATNYRFNINHDGIYLAMCTATFEAHSGGTTRILGITRSGSCRARISVAPQGISAPSLSVASINTFNKGQYVDAFVYQDSTVSLNILATQSSTQARAYLSLHRLS